jgi:LysR family transcriptional regulator, glycine cleavage system transcriptional activator
MSILNRFPVNSLRVFEVAARLGSFTRAGEELGVSQTAVTYQIKLLEQLIGGPLFERRPRHIRLTETGERLSAKATQAFSILRDALLEAENAPDTALAIDSTPTFASQWLARHLGSFQLKHPRLAVRLTSREDLVDFSLDPVDVAIRGGRGDWPGLECHRLMSVDFTPMLSPALAQTVGGLCEPADLLKLPIGDPWWQMWFSAAGIENVDLSQRPATDLGVQFFGAQAAMAGQGVAILTPAFYQDDISLGRLYQPFDICGNDGHAYWLAYPESRRNMRKIREFREWIVEEFRAALIQSPRT